LINTTLKDKVDTSKIELLLGGNMHKEWDKKMPCDVHLFTTEPAPTVTFSNTTNFLRANTTIGFDCQKKADDPVLYHVTNLNLDIGMEFTLRVGENVTIFLDVEKLTL
jgi:hypothetical protein